MSCDELVYQKMEALVKEKGSRKAVADHFGVHPSFITNIMSGVAEPSMRMCQVMGIKRTTTRVTVYREVSSDKM